MPNDGRERAYAEDAERIRACGVLKGAISDFLVDSEAWTSEADIREQARMLYAELTEIQDRTAREWD